MTEAAEAHLSTARLSDSLEGRAWESLVQARVHAAHGGDHGESIPHSLADALNARSPPPPGQSRWKGITHLMWDAATQASILAALTPDTIRLRAGVTQECAERSARCAQRFFTEMYKQRVYIDAHTVNSHTRAVYDPGALPGGVVGLADTQVRNCLTPADMAFARSAERRLNVGRIVALTGTQEAWRHPVHAGILGPGDWAVHIGAVLATQCSVRDVVRVVERFGDPLVYTVATAAATVVMVENGECVGGCVYFRQADGSFIGYGHIQYWVPYERLTPRRLRGVSAANRVADVTVNCAAGLFEPGGNGVQWKATTPKRTSAPAARRVSLRDFSQLRRQVAVVPLARSVLMECSRILGRQGDVALSTPTHGPTQWRISTLGPGPLRHAVKAAASRLSIEMTVGCGRPIVVMCAGVVASPRAALAKEGIAPAVARRNHDLRGVPCPPFLKRHVEEKSASEVLQLETAADIVHAGLVELKRTLRAKRLRQERKGHTDRHSSTPSQSASAVTIEASGVVTGALDNALDQCWVSGGGRVPTSESGGGSTPKDELGGTLRSGSGRRYMSWHRRTKPGMLD